MEVIRSLKCNLGFLTIIPVKGYCSIREIAAGAWVFPVIGGILGVIAGFTGYLFSLFLPWGIASALALFVLLLLTGFHHLDGLLDLGDALMLRGSHRERQRIMHSPGLGAGAFGFGLMVVLITYLALSQMRGAELILSIVVAEASAKLSMLLVARLGSPAWSGIGEDFIRALKKNKNAVVLGVVTFLIITIPLAGIRSLVLFILIAVFSLLMAKLSHSLIGGVSGDVLGASNEITRMLVLVVIV